MDCALRPRRGSRVHPDRARTTRSRPTFVIVRERFPFAAWCRAWGGPAGVLPIGLRRVPGVAVLGREGDAGFADGAIVHCTEIGGTAVAGLWNAFAAWADIADAVSHRNPEAWIVGYDRGAGLDAALAAGFTAFGPLPRLERRRAVLNHPRVTKLPTSLTVCAGSGARRRPRQSCRSAFA